MATITGFTTEDVPTKLYEIGVIPGTWVKLYKKAPFNGPLCIITGKEEAMLALGKKEADSVLVEKVA